MATEIHPAGRVSAELPGTPPSDLDTKDNTKDNIEPYVADLEGEGYEAEKEKLVHQAEAVELTPQQAFAWNVDGDQSPCEHRSLPRDEAIAHNTCSPRGCRLCTQHG
jgi:hypothetical protein